MMGTGYIHQWYSGTSILGITECCIYFLESLIACASFPGFTDRYNYKRESEDLDLYLYADSQAPDTDTLLLIQVVFHTRLSLSLSLLYYTLA